MKAMIKRLGAALLGSVILTSATAVLFWLLIFSLTWAVGYSMVWNWRIDFVVCAWVFGGLGFWAGWDLSK